MWWSVVPAAPPGPVAFAGVFLPVLAQGFAVVVILVAAAGILLSRGRQRRREREALTVLAGRLPGWHLQALPAGIQASMLVGRFDATPRGDRSYGVETGIGGPLNVDINGATVTCQVSCFIWTYERRSGSSRNNGTTYTRHTETVVLCRLPAHTHRAITIRPESALGRMGLTRGGKQLESDAFNRRFRVDGRDRTLLVTLLDANLQQLLVEAFTGRRVELSDDLLVLSGEPDHRDPTLHGAVGAYPAIMQDLQRLLRNVPPPFWRALGLARPEESGRQQPPAGTVLGPPAGQVPGAPVGGDGGEPAGPTSPPGPPPAYGGPSPGPAGATPGSEAGHAPMPPPPPVPPIREDR